MAPPIDRGSDREPSNGWHPAKRDARLYAAVVALASALVGGGVGGGGSIAWLRADYQREISRVEARIDERARRDDAYLVSNARVAAFVEEIREELSRMRESDRRRLEALRDRRPER